jgi:hypothetical protein
MWDKSEWWGVLISLSIVAAILAALYRIGTTGGLP